MTKEEAGRWLRKIYNQLNSPAAPTVNLDRKLKVEGYKPFVSGMYHWNGGDVRISINPKIRKNAQMSNKRKPSPFVTTIIHECLHAAGVDNEHDVNRLTKGMFHALSDRQLFNLLRKVFWCRAKKS